MATTSPNKKTQGLYLAGKSTENVSRKDFDQKPFTFRRLWTPQMVVPKRS